MIEWLIKKMWFSDDEALGVTHREYFDLNGLMPLETIALAVSAVSDRHQLCWSFLINFGILHR